MDITKVLADILDGPNWGTWAVQIQAAARVLNCWAVIKGERIPGVSPPTYDLLQRPLQGNAAGQISDATLFAKSLFEWNKQDELDGPGPHPGKVEPSAVCQNLSLVCSVVGRHLGCPRCTVIGTQCV